MSKQTLFTTGYSGFKGTDFLWKMKQYHIDVVVDVRDNATSRNRDFEQSHLKALLEKCDIEYVHFQALGVPARIRRAPGNMRKRSRYFSEYRKHLDTQQEALESLHELVTRKRCCLLCLETKPEECHRSMLAGVLAGRQDNSIEVKHI